MIDDTEQQQEASTADEHVSSDNTSESSDHTRQPLSSEPSTSDDSAHHSSAPEAVLNPDEIQSLLNESTDQETHPQGWRILVDSSKISYERLPMLEVVFDRLVRLLSTSLRNFTSDNVEVSLKRMTSIRFGDYLNSLELPALINVFKIEEWSTTGLLTIDASFIYSIVDVLLGGRHGAPLTTIEGRSFTTIECNLVQRLAHLILADFTKAFEPVAPVTFRFDRMESNPRFATIVRPVNASILTRIKVEMENRGGFFEFIIPYSSIEPAREQLLQMFMGEKLGAESIWETHFSNEIWEADITLDAILDRLSMNLNDVLSWKPGTQILLRTKPDSLIDIVCGEAIIFSGRIGQRNGHIAIQVENNFIKNGIRS
jgi:flagellar motor switch protein FliM